jgi:MFS family permease
MNNLRKRFNLAQSLRAFNHRNFRLFFWGQLISVIGVWMQSTALQWLVYRITGSQTSLGLVTFINFLPVLLLSLYMGVIVDLDMPARQSFVVEMVDDDRNDLMNAIGLNSILFNIARIIGPAIGGVIVAALGEAPAFFINGITYIAVILALLLMRVPPVPEDASAQRDSMRIGIQYILGEKRIFALVVMVAGYSMIGFGALTLVPVFAKDILKTGVDGFGQLLSAQGVGALIGGMQLVLFGDHFHKGRQMLISRLLLGPGIVVLALSRFPWLSMIMMGVVGYSFITQLVITNTLIQIITPDALRGRVLSTYTWALGGFYPLGSLMIGALGDQIGAPTAALISGAGCILLLVLNQIFMPAIHRLE